MFETLAPALLIAAAVGGVAYALLFPLLSGQKQLETRQKLVARETAQLPKSGGQTRSKRDAVAQSLKELEQREKAKGKLTLEDRFAQAGLAINRRTFYIYSALAGLVCAVLAQAAIGSVFALPVGAVIGGLGMPNWYLNFRRKRRVAKFLIEFPNALDVIVRGLRSGLPLNDCVRIISNEAAEPVKTEFRMMMEAQAVGISLGDAIEDIYRRIPAPEANYFGIIVTIQQKTGGNLAESLANMSKVVRERRKLKGKVQALSAEAKSSAAIIAALPVAVAGIVWFSSPHYIERLWITQAGQFTLVGCAVWMLMGVLIMRKMINFDF